MAMDSSTMSVSVFVYVCTHDDVEDVPEIHLLVAVQWDWAVCTCATVVLSLCCAVALPMPFVWHRAHVLLWLPHRTSPQNWAAFTLPALCNIAKAACVLLMCILLLFFPLQTAMTFSR